MMAPDIGGCMYSRDNIRYPLDEERKRAREFFSHCTTIKDPSKPTIMIVGDLHATHLSPDCQRFTAREQTSSP